MIDNLCVRLKYKWAKETGHWKKESPVQSLPRASIINTGEAPDISPIDTSMAGFSRRSTIIPGKGVVRQPSIRTPQNNRQSLLTVSSLKPVLLRSPDGTKNALTIDKQAPIPVGTPPLKSKTTSPPENRITEIENESFSGPDLSITSSIVKAPLNELNITDHELKAVNDGFMNTAEIPKALEVNEMLSNMLNRPESGRKVFSKGSSNANTSTQNSTQTQNVLDSVPARDIFAQELKKRSSVLSGANSRSGDSQVQQIPEENPKERKSVGNRAPVKLNSSVKQYHQQYKSPQEDELLASLNASPLNVSKILQNQEATKELISGAKLIQNGRNGTSAAIETIAVTPVDSNEIHELKQLKAQADGSPTSSPSDDRRLPRKPTSLAKQSRTPLGSKTDKISAASVSGLKPQATNNARQSQMAAVKVTTIVSNFEEKNSNSNLNLAKKSPSSSDLVDLAGKKNVKAAVQSPDTASPTKQKNEAMKGIKTQSAIAAYEDKAKSLSPIRPLAGSGFNEELQTHLKKRKSTIKGQQQDDNYLPPAKNDLRNSKLPKSLNEELIDKLDQIRSSVAPDKHQSSDSISWQ